MTEIDKDNMAIYVQTLFALARDAWRQDRLEAFEFIKGYLVGLVPGNALQAFVDGLEPSPITQIKRSANNNGGATVTNPVTPPRLPPAPVFRPRESETLKW